MTVDEAERHLEAGQFPAGSMGPKVEAAARFVRHGGRMAVITTPERLLATHLGLAVEPDGRGGTRILPAVQPARSR